MSAWRAFIGRRIAFAAAMLAVAAVAPCDAQPISAKQGRPQALAANDAAPARKMAKIGFLGLFRVTQTASLEAYRDELRKLGYVEGRDVTIEYRFAENRWDLLPALARELVAASIDVLVTSTPPAIEAAQQATKTIPIVMLGPAVQQGFAASLARPGGNVTGVMFQDAEFSAKRLDLLRAVVPDLTRVAFVWNEDAGGAGLRAAEETAAAMGITVRAWQIVRPEDLARAVTEAHAWGARGLIQLPSPFITRHRRALLDALAANRMPASCEWRAWVEDGCLMSYGPDFPAMFRMMAQTTVRVLEGAKPGDIPIMQPREFDFVVNRRTAQVLGLSIPSVVLRQTTDQIR